MTKRYISLLLTASVISFAPAHAEDIPPEYIPAAVNDITSEVNQPSDYPNEQQAQPDDTQEEADSSETIDLGEDIGVHLSLAFSSQIPIMQSLSVSGDDVIISWLAVSGADRYHIYRQKSGDDGWENIGSSQTTSYTDKTAKKSVSYYYCVRAIRGDKSNYVRSERSESYLRVGRPRLILAEESTDGIKLWWNKTEGNKKYYIYRRPKDGKNWHKIGYSSSESFEDKKAKRNTVYEYTVQSSCTNGDKKFLSELGSSGIKGKRSMSMPKITGISGIADRVKIKWDGVKSAELYYIYRLEAGGQWQEIGSTTDTAYLDSTAEPEKTYRYKVRAGHKMYDGSIALGELLPQSVQRPGTVKLSSAESEEKGIRVKWEPVDGALKYRVYRKASENSKWSLLGTTAKKYYLDQNVKYKSYYYTVRAVGKNPDTFFGGFDKKGVEGKYTFGIVEMDSLTNTADGICVKWNKLHGVSGYRLYRKTPDSKKWSAVKTINDSSKTQYTDKDVKSGKKYYYTVRSLKNGKLIEGYDAAGMSIRRLDTPVLVDAAKGSDFINLKWKSVKGADSYEIYRSTDGSEWKKFADVGKDKTDYQDKSVSNGKLYMYCVRAKSSDSISGYNQKGIGRIYLKSVSITSVSHTQSETVSLKWSSNSQADRYVISYSTSEKFTKDTRISSQNNSIDIKGLKKGEIYYFRINALKEKNGTKYFSLWSDTSMAAIEK